jgi:DMSO/TMAO reductase YedYZ heme-binding membrane subunit
MEPTREVRAHPFWLAWANRPSRAMAWTLVVSLAVAVGTLALHGTAALGWRAATRTTAQVAYPLFLLAFVASPLARLWPGPRTRAVLARRRALGLAFATAHLVHGMAILVLASRVPGTLEADVAFWGGALGFAFVVAMAATSNDAAQRALGGGRWRALHGSGQWILFVIFAVTYAGRFAENPRYAPGVALLGLALALRLAAALQSRSLRSRTLPIE